MTAYAVILREKPIGDDAAYQEYKSVAAANRGEHVIKPLVMYGAVDAAEGKASDGVVILEFPTMEAAKAWYDSPGYQKAVPHRIAADADYRVMFVEGV